MSNRAAAGAGGSGAGYHAEIVITEGGLYNVVVGTGGIGKGGPKNTNASGSAGTASTLKKGSTTLISAGGGGAGVSWQSSASGGAGGTLTKNIQETTVYVSSNGNNGGSRNSAGSVNGAASKISGHTWGGSGACSCNYSGGSANSSYHGYVLIKYLGA